MNRITLTTKSSKDYELLDSGSEEKLERFGDIVLARPDPQALWSKKLPEEEWRKASGRYVREGREGEWQAKNLPQEWQIEFGNLKFLIKPTSFKHTGLFPEQLSNWNWIGERLSKSSLLQRDIPHSSAKPFVEPQILNLFGYTAGATLAAAKAGAEVTHVDASKTAVAWARENAKLSGLEDKPIKWMVEDVLAFVKRQIKRGNKYDGIVMDPPAFGHGPKNELWKIEEDFVELVKLCGELLSEKPLFFLINGYAAGYSPLAFAYNLEFLQNKFGGEIEYGDLTIEEKGSGRLLPCGIFARWQNK
jgi:23S rRNA (cytosine1962-C5)-methyltransferase